MKKKKNKITAELDKEIRVIAASLPKLQAIDNGGRPIFYPRRKDVTWDQLNDSEKANFPNEKFLPQAGKIYTIRWSEPAMEDHYANLCHIYKHHGLDGVEGYVGEVNKITDKANTAASTIHPTDIKDPETVKGPEEPVKEIQAAADPEFNSAVTSPVSHG
jgi:hypothetical protein